MLSTVFLPCNYPPASSNHTQWSKLGSHWLAAALCKILYPDFYVSCPPLSPTRDFPCHVFCLDGEAERLCLKSEPSLAPNTCRRQHS